MKRQDAVALLKKANQYLTDSDFSLPAEYRPKIAKWLKALRSDKYAQGSGQLFDHALDSKKGAYCCLGVYCKEIYRASNQAILGASYPAEAEYNFPLSDEVQEALATLNDGSIYRDIESHSFSQIADIVEAAYLA